MLEKGWICPSVSPYGASILFVHKKMGELRMCIDFRSLDRQTRLDMFPIPRIHDLLDKLGKACVFSAVDLLSAYHQVRIKEGYEHRTAFFTPMGLYEYVVIPLGLTNVPTTFHCIMNQTFQGSLYKCAMVYLDDILVFYDSVEQHLADLQKVSERLRTSQFKAKLQKCEFGKGHVKYLGHVVENDTVYADPNKVSAVRTWPKPTNVKEVQQFIGLQNYYE